MSGSSKGRHTIFTLVTLIFVVVVTLVLGELLLLSISPQAYMFPRYQFSKQYGIELPRNAKIEHKKPGHWRFSYTVNEHGYRGKVVPLSTVYDRENILVLGDSFSFGIGVDDGQEYPSIMNRTLQDRYDIINLSMGGYGLTQQIRRYFEFGRLYKPSSIIIQFSGNDPYDNIHNRVTVVDNGQFAFMDTCTSFYRIKKLLSNSLIQYSQLYNFLRQRLWVMLREKDVNRVSSGESDEADRQRDLEVFHSELLTAFVRDLSQQRVLVLFIAVNDHLKEYPLIRETVNELHDDGCLRYVEVADWFAGTDNYASPEGHAWGVEAHKLIGVNLAEIIKDLEKVVEPSCRPRAYADR